MSEKENFLTIKENGTGELIIKKSRFIANIARTTTTDAANDFIQKADGATIMTDEARKRFLTGWQKNKMVELNHPYLKEKIEWGLVPFAQAQLLARCIRGDTDGYAPFLWK